MNVQQLLSHYNLVSTQVSKQEIGIILNNLQLVIDQKIAGAVVEFGCYNGTTSLFIQRLLQTEDPHRAFHVYDSFAGLPEKSSTDLSPAGEQFKTGELQVARSEFVHHFKQAHIPLPTIHKSWFDELSPKDIPHPIALAFLDGDYYDSIKTSLRLIQPNLSPGAVIIVDDYQSEALPGAAKATNEWLRDKPRLNLKLQASLAIIHPKDS